MKAITYDRFGPADKVLTLEDLPIPVPGPGEVLVRLRTSGVNPSDVKVRAGGRPGVIAPPYPKIIPHSDGAGVVEAVGAGVPDRAGERVWIWNGQWRRAFGTAAEYIAVPSEQAVRLPDHVSFEEGATLGIPGITAVHSVLGGGPVQGKRVLVSGGAGTVGHLAVQVARASGAEVLATARGEGLTAAEEAGAHYVFDYTSKTLPDDILDATGGRLIDRIVEVEFGANAETNAKVIAERGTIAAFGSAKDMAPTMPFYPLMFKAVNVDLVLVYLLSRVERSLAQASLLGLLDKKVLNIRVEKTIELTKCAQAHDRISEMGRCGSVVIQI